MSCWLGGHRHLDPANGAVSQVPVFLAGTAVLFRSCFFARALEPCLGTPPPELPGPGLSCPTRLVAPWAGWPRAGQLPAGSLAALTALRPSCSTGPWPWLPLAAPWRLKGISGLAAIALISLSVSACHASPSRWGACPRLPS